MHRFHSRKPTPPESYIFIRNSSIFNQPFDWSDHRGLFVDIDEVALFGATLNTLLPPVTRTITSKSNQMIKKFLQAIKKQDVVHQMLLDLVELKKRDKWNQHHHIQLETIDQNFTKLLLTAEKQCAIPIEYPWSPQLDQKAKKF
jgi:hypothetical protein